MNGNRADRFHLLEVIDSSISMALSDKLAYGSDVKIEVEADIPRLVKGVENELRDAVRNLVLESLLLHPRQVLKLVVSGMQARGRKQAIELIVVPQMSRDRDERFRCVFQFRLVESRVARIQDLPDCGALTERKSYGLFGRLPALLTFIMRSYVRPELFRTFRFPSGLADYASKDRLL